MSKSQLARSRVLKKLVSDHLHQAIPSIAWLCCCVRLHDIMTPCKELLHAFLAVAAQPTKASVHPPTAEGPAIRAV